MGENSQIEWTDYTLNALTGCSVVSPGCTNCYAMHLSGTRLKGSPKYKGLTLEVKGNHVWTGEVRFDEKPLLEIMRKKRPRLVFVNSMSDLFHEKVKFAWIAKHFAAFAMSPQHTYQILTKRADRMFKVMNDPALRDLVAQYFVSLTEQMPDGTFPTSVPWPLPNVWLGVSAEDQTRAEERIPFLMMSPAAVRWISAEPLLGPIDFTRLRLKDSPFRFDALRANAIFDDDGDPAPAHSSHEALDWIVVGGESGRDARVMRAEWAKGIRDQCVTAGVPFHFKQWGEFAPEWRSIAPHGGESVAYVRTGKKAAGRLLEGREWNEWPKRHSAAR